MGSPKIEVDHRDDETQHKVKVSEFYMSKYAITVAEFRRFVEATGFRTEAEKKAEKNIQGSTTNLAPHTLVPRNGVYSCSMCVIADPSIMKGLEDYARQRGVDPSMLAGVFGAAGIGNNEPTKRSYDAGAYFGECPRHKNATGWSLEKEEVLVTWYHDVFGRVQSDETHPVLHVSWYDAVAFANWLSEKKGKRFRLPTEAEWEYACRAGTSTPFNTGNNLTTNQANYDGNFPYNNNPKGVYRQNTVAVNSFAPNTLGLYNMHGNVWEWCSDWFGGTYYDECKANGTVTNPVGPATGSRRVIRGGGWDDFAVFCRSAERSGDAPGHRNANVGFRLVFVP